MSTTVSKHKYMMTANPRNGYGPQTLCALVGNFKKNFLEREIEIVPGLMHNQYEIVKRIYFYSHNTFESGPVDENENPKYFYDLITDRNDQSTKNINVNTKDAYIKSETQGSYLKTWMLRREFVGYAKTSGFGMKLNDLADDLPDFGTVVWKKILNEEKRVDVSQVELINLMNDPSVKRLKDGLVVERHMLTQYDMAQKKSWDRTAVQMLITSGKGSTRVGFLDSNTAKAQYTANQIDETTPYYEVYEMWGEIPRDMYEQHKTGGLPRKDTTSTYATGFYKASQSSYGVRTSPRPKDATTSIETLNPSTVSVSSYFNTNETVYVMAVVAGIEEGENGSVLFCKEVSRDMFPYKEVHYRRRKGRWLGLGNYELCFGLIEKANEITNRFFSSLRIALLHLYQTRDSLHVKNFLEDLVDGDLTVSKSEITAIPTEIRGFTQYQDEINRIEAKADRLCNSFEVVTGANLPSGTPWKLGNQQLQSATKLFEYVRENMSLFIEDVFNSWLLEDFAKSLTEEHILELMDDMDDIEIYYTARRKMFQYQFLKEYILENEAYPTVEELRMVGGLVKDKIKKGPKQLTIERKYYMNLKYSVKMVIDGENDRRQQNNDTLTSLYESTVANVAALQDPRLMKILNMILENSGYSPLEVNAVNETETNPLLNPANQGGGGVERSMNEQMPGGGAVPSPVQGGGQRAAVTA
jgi:hypothetical protein